MNANLGRSEDELSDPLKTVIESIASDKPDKVQMDSFLSSLKKHPPIRTTSHNSKHSKPLRNRMLIALISTATLVAILFGLKLLPTANALEQIAKALSNVQCIKATTVIDDSKSERWLVPSTGQTVCRDDKKIEFADRSTATLTTYDLRTEELVRSLLPEQQSSAMLVELVESLAATGKGDMPKSIRGMAIQSARIERGGIHRILYLDLLSPDGAIRGTAKITLQDTGDLPLAGVVNLSRGNMTQQIETTWEYPPYGPTDIFELGVPRGTPLIDRIPTPAVKQLVADVYKGRLQFDDYRAVVFATTSETLHDLDAFEVSLVSKKANRLVRLRNADDLVALEGQSRKEVAAQILADPQMIKWEPTHLIDGETHYSFRAELPKGFHTSRSSDMAEGFTMPGYDRVPHLVGRPPTGIGQANIGAALELTADGVPADCVLLRTYQTLMDESQQSPVQQSPVQQIRDEEYWISRTKGFLVLKSKHQWQDGSTTVLTLGELVQSPSGCWYPISASRTRVDRPDRTTVDSYHVDFSGPLTDAMFDPDELVKLLGHAKSK